MVPLSEVLGSHVQFVTTALDRIVLHGDLDRLQRPASLVSFLHEVAHLPRIDPAALASRTPPSRTAVQHDAATHGIPLLVAPRGVRKDEFVQPHDQRLHGAEGIACILTSMEQGRTFVSYTPRTPPPSGDPTYRRIAPCRKRFLHYYFSGFDPVMGPMSLRVATYLPFNITCSLNGHSFIAQEVTRDGVAFHKQDNLILRTADPAAVQAAADRLTAAVLQQRCDYWAARLAPPFSPAERAAVDLRYHYSISHLERATDVVFTRAAAVRARFARAIELGVAQGGADRTTYLFGRRITRRHGGTLRTVLEGRNEGHPVLKADSQTSFVKQYEKADRVMRTETCSNDPYHLAIGRRLANLPAVVEQMATTNTRYLTQQAALLDSTVDTGTLADLARPTRRGQRRIPGIKLQDDRVLRVLEAALHPGNLVGDWTSAHLHQRVCERQRLAATDYRLSQLRYDLSKLRAHGLVERVGRPRRYRLTERGLKLGVILVKARTRLLGPLVTGVTEPPAPRSSTPSDIERALRAVDTALTHLCDLLGLHAA